MKFFINIILVSLLIISSNEVRSNTVLDSSKNKNFINLDLFNVGYTKHGLYSFGVTFDNKHYKYPKNKYLLGIDYLTDKSFAYKFGIGRTFNVQDKGVIEALVSYRFQPYFRSDQFDYLLKYGKLRSDFSYYHDKNKPNYLFFSHNFISENQAIFVNGKPTFKSVPFNNLRFGYYHQKSNDFSNSQQLIQLERGDYKNTLSEVNSYTNFKYQASTNLAIDKSRKLKLGLFLSYHIQNSKRVAQSYANELVKGSISLSGQSMADYLYEHTYFSRKGSINFLDNQAANEGGRMRFFNTRGTALGLSNDLGFSITSSVELVKNRFFTISPYLDYGGVKNNAKMKYLYSGGLEIRIKESLEIYLPFFQSQELKSANNFVQENYFHRIGFNFDFRKMYFNKNHFTPIR
jgi:hypothetical protein